MPQKVIKLKGINRAINEFQTSGECEELINLRPTSSGISIVRSKSVIAKNKSGFKKIIEHSFGSHSNLIAITHYGVLWIDKEGNTLQSISGASAKDICYSGDMILVNNVGESQQCFKFKDDQYSEYILNIPSPKISVTLSDFTATGSYIAPSIIDTIYEAKEALAYAYSDFYQKNPNGLAGPIVIGCTFELEGGAEIWSSAFTIIDPTKDVNYTHAKISATSLTTTVYGAKEATLRFNLESFKQDPSIKNIKFYSSLPLASFDVEKSSGIFVAMPVSNSSINIDGQPMYLIETKPYGGFFEFVLKTDSSIAGNDLMPVTTGTIKRIGDAISYNNRFHFFNSGVYHVLQNPSLGVHSNRSLPAEDHYNNIKKAELFVEINNGEEKILVKGNNLYDIRVSETIDFIYPLGNIKQGYIYAYDEGNYASGSWYSVPLRDSSAYNYSCAIDFSLTEVMAKAPDGTVIENHAQTILLNKEYDAINVSAQNNPFVFPVNNSYAVGGKIIDVATSYLPIGSTKVERYPISIFTSNGIFALGQGDKSVLYGKTTAVSPLVITGRAVPTPPGIFFISSNNLYVISEGEAIDVSEAFRGERETRLREIEAYKTLCLNSGHNILYDFTDLVSAIDFKDFINNSVLVYDAFENELYISNKDQKYSYVFNLDSKQFHKIPKRYSETQYPARYALESDIDNVINIVDLHNENDAESQPILLQSRPMSLEAFYTHIQRIIMLVDTGLVDKQHLCFTVFGSNNLYDWDCIISAQKKDVTLRQIRTNKSAKSYKDYVILINGVVPTDTNISDIIADYTVVNRRLG
jgi:hypothetical protein